MHIYIGVLFSCLISVCAASNHSTWDYSQQGSDWVKKGYTKCGGKKQSPVNIADATCDKALNNSITLTKYDSAGIAKFTLTNTGHSLKLDTASTGAQVKLGSLGTFNLQQLHFHWGKDNKKGSEHTLKGKAFAAEMHLVHTNIKYSTFNEAKTKANGLAVLGVFIKVGAENPTAKTFLKFTANIMDPGKKVSVPQFAMNKLLPENQDVFYRYAGSLTTPTCDETVTWTVFEEPISFSESQLAQLRALKDEKNKTLVDNYRSVQDLNDRKITFWNEQECPSGAEAVGASIVLAFLSLLLFTLN